MKADPDPKKAGYRRQYKHRRCMAISISGLLCQYERPCQFHMRGLFRFICGLFHMSLFRSMERRFRSIWGLSSCIRGLFRSLEMPLQVSRIHFCPLGDMFMSKVGRMSFIRPVLFCMRPVLITMRSDQTHMKPVQVLIRADQFFFVYPWQ